MVPLMAAVFVFKEYVHTALGAADFNLRIAVLSDEATVKKDDGFAMQADPSATSRCIRRNKGRRGLSLPA
jgi:hypothetical protein